MDMLGHMEYAGECGKAVYFAEAMHNCAADSEKRSRRV
jgi:hypothetical protein